MVKKADIPDHVIDTAMALTAERGWSDLSLAEIAEAAGLPLAKVAAHYGSKQAILAAFTRRIDAAVLADAEADALEGSAKDRLFDVLMRRFDALDPHRKALGNLILDQTRDPGGALCAAIGLRRSLALMLEAAGLSATGLRGLVRIKGLALIYLAALRVWLKDESADKAKTMAALDRQLTRADGLLRRLSRRPGGGADAAPEAASEAPSEG